MQNGDPLKDKNLVPDRARELFEIMSKACDGFSAGDVLAASINMVVNCVRQSKPTRMQAEQLFDRVTGEAKHMLLERHYHGDGSRRNIFPHVQHVNVPGPKETGLKFRK